ncbi:MAG: glyceraldehyde 3-phosphate dehydrogenase NAD-binding domain-containing protein [Candidatus Babeliales bacterium]
MKIAINGLGRIGRNFLRTIMLDPQAKRLLDVVAINVGPADPKMAAHMFKYDTLMGTWNGQVSAENGHLVIDNHTIRLLAFPDITKVDWGALGVEWVVDCSGKFTQRDKAAIHIKQGAKKVLISAPCATADAAIIPGVNDYAYNPAQDTIVSLGSCTTNALLPLLKVVHDAFGIQKATMTTVHAYTNTQVLIDVERGDLRRSRAAALNIIPSSTGAVDMVDIVMPELAGKVTGIALRVPVATVSLVDLVFVANKEMTIASLNEKFSAAAQGSMSGIVNISMEPLVSSDYQKSPYSVVVDGLLTQAMGNFGQLFGWYDNEWSYSVRLRDFLMRVATGEK